MAARTKNILQRNDNVQCSPSSRSAHEIVRASDDAVKTAILDQRSTLSTEDLLERLHERRSMRDAFLETKGA